MTSPRVVEHTDSDLPHTVVTPADRDVCPAHGHREPSWLQRRFHAAIVFYQRAREGRPSPCRFFPSCSAYALEAVDVHGAWRGGWLSTRRLLRCRPLGPSGIDLVPHGRPSTAPCHCPDDDASTSPTVVTSPQQKGG